MHALMGHRLSKSVSSAFLLKAMRGWCQEVSQSITTYYICTYTYTYTFLKYHLCIKKYIYSHPFMKKTQLATRKIKIQRHETLRWKLRRCPPVKTCRSKGPPKPGSCSKELRPPLRRFLSLGKREGWNIEPKNEDIMNRTYIYIYMHSLYYLKVTICTLAPFCFRSMFAML